ncbi:FAD/NAD(P)-binding domain-containing protein [Mycena indigotica]|uniref:FAD/NAD(P)-binding domain-containing protein n=1 Tax=Mycena indigotica TaxID=2126181 RepID=A0A8H6S1X8_9AGAR|nr:FAD/NAD(P)-binding domain-containing protein [Mycena indigotica]KAF7290828.1 FAD/NAD(P)-binding domain-containing protein [Mycena indigotica]
MWHCGLTKQLTGTMVSTLPSSTVVCIVGAGPSGLACALGISARNIPFVIVDALETGHSNSRSVGVHASALEALYSTHPGLVNTLVSDGVPSSTIRTVDLYEQLVFEQRLSDLAPYTKFPFILLIPQHTFEQRMHEVLPEEVTHWGKKVVAMCEDGGHYRLFFQSGETLEAQYIVAADGSKSTMRKLANIKFLHPFTGKDVMPDPSDPSYVAADVIFEKPLPPNVPKDSLQIMVGGGGMVLTAPLRSGQKDNEYFRLYLGVPDIPPPRPDQAYLQAVIDARGPGSHAETYPKLKIKTVLDSTRFQSRRGLAERFVHRSPGGGNIMLIGDAAHTHGPGGAQGMHLAICDGCELAEAISTHSGSLEALTAWGGRRRAIARQVIDRVEGIMEVESGKMDWTSWIRLKALRAIHRLPFVGTALIWRISGLVYRESPVAVGNGKADANGDFNSQILK